MRWFYVVLAAVILGAAVAPALGQSEYARQVTRTITLSTKARLGYYVPLTRGEPKRLTVREEEDLVSRGVPADSDRRRQLSGAIEYSPDHGLAIVIQTDAQGDVNAKLRAIGAIPSEDVRVLVCIGQVDFDGLKIIAGFGQLRDLTIEASQLLESPEGATRLAQLEGLRYLEVVPKGDRKFGSRSFCEACLLLKELTYIAMPCEKLTDSNVTHLARHLALERLYLRTTKPVLGRTSLEALSRMNKLRELGIVCTDDITDGDVMGFAEIPSLELLNISTKAPLTCQERFKSRCPDCTITIVDLLEELP